MLELLAADQIIGLVVAVAVALSGLIEISPIKLNPWSWLGKQIGKAVNGDVLTQIESLKDELSSVKSEVTDLQEKSAERAALSARKSILRFGDEILHGVKHSKDSFDDILLTSTDYEQYCRTHPDFKNNLTERVAELIKRTYDKRLEDNDFLY